MTVDNRGLRCREGTLEIRSWKREAKLLKENNVELIQVDGRSSEEENCESANSKVISHMSTGLQVKEEEQYSLKGA
jgi:hypothetical protein